MEGEWSEVWWIEIEWERGWGQVLIYWQRLIGVKSEEKKGTGGRGDEGKVARYSLSDIFLYR